MANEVSTLRNKTSLTIYDEGVTFTVKTPSGDYDVDHTTAAKLSDLLVSPGETKFVKIKTSQGQIVLNISSIMAVAVDERSVKGVLAFIRAKTLEVARERDIDVPKVLRDDPDIIDWFFARYPTWASARLLPRVDRGVFEYYFRKAVADTDTLKDAPAYENGDTKGWF